MVKRIGSIVALWCVVCGRRNTCQRARPDREHGGRRSLRAGWLRSFFLGAHWRDGWETPVEVPVLNLELFDGGLRPDRLSGGSRRRACTSRAEMETCGRSDRSIRPPIETTFSAWTTMLPRRRPGPVDKVICASGLRIPPAAWIPTRETRSWATTSGTRRARRTLAELWSPRPCSRPLASSTRGHSWRSCPTIRALGSSIRTRACSGSSKRGSNTVSKVRPRYWDRHLEQWRWARYEKDGERGIP